MVTASEDRRYTNDTLPETNIAHENSIFPGKYHQNGGFSMAMLVSGRVSEEKLRSMLASGYGTSWSVVFSRRAVSGRYFLRNPVWKVSPGPGIVGTHLSFLDLFGLCCLTWEFTLKNKKDFTVAKGYKRCLEDQ